ncbi:MAG: MYXO-CTERM sorting domain-containing protein [Myxococcota bacterium]
MRALVLALSLTAATPALAQDMGEDAGAEDMGMGDLGVEDQGVDAGQDQGVDAGPTSAEEVEFFLAKGGGCAAGGAPGLLAALAFVGLAIRRRR